MHFNEKKSNKKCDVSIIIGEMKFLRIIFNCDNSARKNA